MDVSVPCVPEHYFIKKCKILGTARFYITINFKIIKQIITSLPLPKKYNYGLCVLKKQVNYIKNIYSVKSIDVISINFYGIINKKIVKLMLV